MTYLERSCGVIERCVVVRECVLNRALAHETCAPFLFGLVLHELVYGLQHSIKTCEQ